MARRFTRRRGSYNAATAGLLLRHGARVDALNRERQTPLAYALQGCGNIKIEGMAALAELLLAAGARQTPEMKAFVARIGTDFEFHRSGFNPDFVEATSAGARQVVCSIRGAAGSSSRSA